MRLSNISPLALSPTDHFSGCIEDQLIFHEVGVINAQAFSGFPQKMEEIGLKRVVQFLLGLEAQQKPVNSDLASYISVAL